MHSWTSPNLPALPGQGAAPRLTDTRTGEQRSVTSDDARLYVCGITPYDATHLGHAATYVAFDVLVRAWKDARIDVTYAQNITDVDDPLFERASETGVDWRELADSQIELFRSDMSALRVIPPTHWVAVSEVIADIESAIGTMDAERLYALEDEATEGRSDLYAELGGRIDPDAPHLAPLNLESVFGENGGDPGRAGKRHPLDPQVWKGVMGGNFTAQPRGDEVPGVWRPGWHIECAVIAKKFLGSAIDVQGGGSDLVFPHHEMTVEHLADLDAHASVDVQMNTGMVAYEGLKMSKSKGNLVFVSKLLDHGTDPMVVRLALLAHRWDENWEFHEEYLKDAERRLTLWRRARHAGGGGAEELLATVRSHIANNLDTPAALEAIDAWASQPRHDEREGAAMFAAMCDSLLGVSLDPAGGLGL